MAKTSGSTRVSKWRPANAPLSADLYYHAGRRMEYWDKEFPKYKKDIIKKTAQRIAKELRKKYQGSVSEKEIDGGEKINVVFTKKGIEHITNDALLTLSGKYFSETSMMRIKEIFDSSEYVKTPHENYKERPDKRALWFAYKDTEGRGVYFKAAVGTSGQYEIHSVSDRLKKE